MPATPLPPHLHPHPYVRTAFLCSQGAAVAAALAASLPAPLPFRFLISCAGFVPIGLLPADVLQRQAPIPWSVLGLRVGFGFGLSLG